jgi:hypothetical protein
MIDCLEQFKSLDKFEQMRIKYHWLIKGIGIHGVPIDLWDKIPFEWIIINYNYNIKNDLC